MSCADGLLADPRDEVLDDLEVDVGLEQREADLAHGGIDVGLADPAAAGQVAERLRRRSLRVSNTVRSGLQSVVDRPVAARRSREPGGARVLTHRGGRSVAQGPRERRRDDGPAVTAPAAAMLRPRAQPLRVPALAGTTPSSASGRPRRISIFGSLITRMALPLVAILTLGAGADRGRHPARHRPRRRRCVVGLVAGAWVDRLRRRPGAHLGGPRAGRAARLDPGRRSCSASLELLAAHRRGRRWPRS